MSEQTTQEAYLAEMLGDVYSLRIETEASLQNINKMRDAIAESFVSVEKSICEMNILVEDSVQKAGDRASATLAVKLDVMIQQMTNYQVDSLNKIRDFFIGEAEKTRTEQLLIATKEIEEARQNATKEIANLIHRINGNKLENKLIAYALIFALGTSLITSSINYVLIKSDVKDYTSVYSQSVENSTITPKQKR